MRISNPVKALITGAVMVITSLLIYMYKGSFDTTLAFIPYAMYVAGISWVLLEHHRGDEPKNFLTYFMKGFRFFLVVALVMVVFTYVFLKFNSEVQAQAVQEYADMIKHDADLTPAEMENSVKQLDKYFVTMMISRAIMGYLLIGGFVTAVMSGVLILNRRNNR